MGEVGSRVAFLNAYNVLYLGIHGKNEALTSISDETDEPVSLMIILSGNSPLLLSSTTAALWPFLYTVSRLNKAISR